MCEFKLMLVGPMACVLDFVYETGVFVPGKPFQPSVMFVGEVRCI